MTHSWRHWDSCHCRHYALICLSLPLCVFPSLSLHSLTLWCSAGLPPFLLPPPLPSGSRLRGAEAAKKLTSWSWCSLPLLFVGLPVLPLWSGRSELTLWEKLPDAQTAGEIILSFCLCQDFFFFDLALCVCLQRSVPPLLYCFSIYFAKLQVYLYSMQSEFDSPEADLLLTEQPYEGQHYWQINLTDIIQPYISDQGTCSSLYLLIWRKYPTISHQVVPSISTDVNLI